MCTRLFFGNIGMLTILVLTGLTLSGCDYWPPALQHEIEELRADLMTPWTSVNNWITTMLNYEPSMRHCNVR